MPSFCTQRGTTGGRDHWPQAGFALLAGGGLRIGQVVGATDARGELPRGQPYTPQNVLATLYSVLGIDPAATLRIVPVGPSRCQTIGGRSRSWHNHRPGNGTARASEESKRREHDSHG
jgi:hypothetical protein